MFSAFVALILGQTIKDEVPISYQYEKPLVVEYTPPEPIEPPVEVVIERCEGIYCSCMTYLQIRKNLALYGDAIDQVPNKPLWDIEVGDVILINYDGVGHASYVEYRFPKAVWVSEANYIEGEYSERAIELDDKRIVGAMRVHKREVVTIDL